MLELGVKSNFYHKNLSKFINSTEIDKLLFMEIKFLILTNIFTRKKEIFYNQKAILMKYFQKY